jgi:hypothetical protein
MVMAEGGRRQANVHPSPPYGSISVGIRNLQHRKYHNKYTITSNNTADTGN